MKILFFGQAAWEEEYMKEKLSDVELIFRLGGIEEVGPEDAQAEVISVFVNSHIDAAVLDRFPNLKLIATRSTGFDHIDVAEAHKRNIEVSTVPSYGVNTVAEFAFALMLELSRKVGEANQRVTQTGSFAQEGLTGFDLQGKTIGIVGCGRIGLHMVKIANGFGMHPLVYDTRHDYALAGQLGFAYVELEELLAKSDIVSLHVPYNEHTHHLIHKGNITHIKKGAYLINTSRGAVMETAALIDALEHDIIAGAGLDVLEEEGNMDDELELLSGPHPKEAELRVLLANHYLIKHPRVIITPHVAFDTKEAIQRILDTTIENVTSFRSGSPTNMLPR